MAFQDMVSELHGCVPKIPWDYSKTLVNRAWRDLRRKNLWSFLLFDANWVAPPVISAGLVTTVQGLNTVTFNGTATAAINAATGNIITQRQFRMSYLTIYNIWAWNDSTGVATLDRPFAEASSSNVGYSIYQCYYPAPMKDWLAWGSVRDLQNFIDLYTDRLNRVMLDAIDPQRTVYTFPTDVVPYSTDLNPASPTYQYPLFELWGQPNVNLIYQLYGMRRGTPLVNPTDTLPPPIGEDVVIALAKTYAYEWAEANKDNTGPRGSSPDYKFLMGKSSADYLRLYKEYRRDDREFVDNYFSLQRRGLYGKFYAEYSSATASAFPGSAW